MGKDYFKKYYKNNRDKLKEQQKINYYKRKNLGNDENNTQLLIVKRGNFIINFN